MKFRLRGGDLALVKLVGFLANGQDYFTYALVIESWQDRQGARIYEILTEDANITTTFDEEVMQCLRRYK